MKLSIVKSSVLIGAVLAASVSTVAKAGFFSGNTFRPDQHNGAVRMNLKGSGIRAREQRFMHMEKGSWSKVGSATKATPSFYRRPSGVSFFGAPDRCFDNICDG